MNIPELNSVDTSDLLKNIQSILHEKSVQFTDNQVPNEPTASAETKLIFPLIEEKNDMLPTLGRHVNIWA